VRWIALILTGAAALAGCGGGGDDSASGGGLTVVHTPTTTVAETGQATGPLVRICNRSLASEARAALRSQGSKTSTDHSPHATGTRRLSACHLGPVELTLDNAPDAVKRYQNRIVETTQFFGGHQDRIPQQVGGVGARSLGESGANWLPWIHQLLSARGKRVLIVTVHDRGLRNAQSLAAAKEVSLIVWDRLGS
jgi:hypothetical protein